MRQRISVTQRRANPISRRLRFWASRLFGTRLQKSQKLYFVTINGKRFKRIVEPDSYTAACIEKNLVRFGESPHLPRFVSRYEREIWVDFVEGEVAREPSDAFVCGLADLYAALHERDSRRIATSDSPYPDQLQRNLHFLHGMGVLGEAAYADLRDASERLAPSCLWVGFDFTDSVLKNFVVARDGGRICAVDVESLSADGLIGMGFAKAAELWMGEHRALFLDRLARPGVPDIRGYLPFIELHFLAHWMQRAFMERKWQYVDASRFERLRHAEQAVSLSEK